MLSWQCTFLCIVTSDVNFRSDVGKQNERETKTEDQLRRRAATATVIGTRFFEKKMTLID